MKGSENSASGSPFRSLPSVDALIRSELGKRLSETLGPARVVSLARSVIDSLRDEIAEGAVDTDASFADIAQDRLESEYHRMRRRGQQPVINATGVIIHTNLGRAPLSEEAARAVAEAASGYCSIEFDVESGKRGRRGTYSEELLCEVTGAEAALVVNNCAAAAFLVLAEFAAGGEVVISRGELVEIGGDFRVPDVLVRSGARLREVGTTNRTKLADYEKAVSDDTRLILRVHPSNYRVVGFTASPSLEEIAELAHKHGLIFYEDAGSGALIDLRQFGIDGEPLISESIAAGTDIVTFSGDKLMGGPQCGLIVGRRELIARLRKNPLYRALRVDKLTYAALQATLEAYARGTAAEEIPVLASLGKTTEAIEKRVEKFIDRLKGEVGRSSDIASIPGDSAVGGGAAPTVLPPTRLMSVRSIGKAPENVAEELRMRDVPVISRIVDDRVVLDLRTVFESEEDELLKALVDVLSDGN